MAEDKTNGADAPEEKKEDKAPEAPKPETKPEAKEEPKQEVAEPKADDKEKVEIPKKFAKLVDELGAMSTLELSELVKVLESHFGVSAAAPMAMAAAPAGGEAGGAGGAEEKKEFTVTLADAGAQKVAVIKAVKEVTGLGLGEAKAIVDAAPKAVKENVPKEEADEAKAKLEEAGATVELS